jgi:hypothetical protein
LFLFLVLQFASDVFSLFFFLPYLDKDQGTWSASPKNSRLIQGRIYERQSCRFLKFRRIVSLLFSKHQPSRIKTWWHPKEGLGERETVTRDGNGRKWKVSSRARVNWNRPM